MRGRLIWTACLLLTAAAIVSAQSTNARVETTSGLGFRPSPEPSVTRYEVHLSAPGKASPPVVDLGLPTPNAVGEIIVRPLSVFATMPANTLYSVMVVAVTPEGTSAALAPEAVYRRECTWYLTVFYGCGWLW